MLLKKSGGGNCLPAWVRVAERQQAVPVTPAPALV